MREEAMARMDYSKGWMLALILYAQEHKDQLPTDFGQAKAFLPQEAKAELEAAADQLEIVYQGNWTKVTNPANTVVLREQQARQSPDGKWSKAYGFADGHSEIHVEADGNFEAWEKEHIVSPAAPSQ
jgi:hypothetical protein